MSTPIASAFAARYLATSDSEPMKLPSFDISLGMSAFGSRIARVFVR